MYRLSAFVIPLAVYAAVVQASMKRPAQRMHYAMCSMAQQTMLPGIRHCSLKMCLLILERC